MLPDLLGEHRASEAAHNAAFVSLLHQANPIHRKLVPLRTSHLQTFLDLSINSKTFNDLLFITIVSCAFYGCHRIGELVQRMINPNCLTGIKSSNTLLSHFQTTIMCNINHKSDPFYHGTDVHFVLQGITNPVTLLKQHCHQSDSIHGLHAPLFLHENGSHPTHSWFEHRLHNLLPSSYGAHSMRAGGATFYASLGLNKSIIQSLRLPISSSPHLLHHHQVPPHIISSFSIAHSS